MKPNNFRKPRTGDRPLRVQFRNGWIVGPYTASQLVWEDRGWLSDIVAVEFADAKQVSSTWNAKSGGY